jgi:NAD(P)-dependent dehydrogenase (short-subunit alcohol dehydrogenase family)
MKLRGQIAIVTGASRGIGKSIADRLAADGATVVRADVQGDVETLDVTDEAAVDALFHSVAQRHGRLDILVNNAGVGLTKLMVDTSLDEWDRVLRVNLTGVFLCAKAAARVMMAQRSGRIINLASLSGQRGGTGRAAYGASKAGVTALTKVMAVELSPHGITVNEIAPGPVNTEMTAVTHDQATREAYYNLIPMRRYAERDEIAAAASFLASDDARFVNGQTLNVDGGFGAAGLIFDLKG